MIWDPQTITNRVRDEDGRARDPTPEEEATIASKKPPFWDSRQDVELKMQFDDPMLAMLFFTGLRNAMGGIDIEDVQVELSYRVGTGSRAQGDALRDFIENSWSVVYAKILSETRYYPAWRLHMEDAA